MKIGLKDESGQSTVELAVVFPVVLIVACIAVNATLCFSQCAKFDRIFKQTVCSICTSPGYGQNIGNLNSQVAQYVKSNFDLDNVDIDTKVNSVSGNYYEIQATICIKPTLFGLGLKDEIFGVPLYVMKHSQKMVVDIYKPGVVF